MIYRLTLINCADATNIRCSRVFHLYRGFYKRRALPNNIVRASARRVTPPQLIYRNFKVKIYKKGDVARFIIIRTRCALAAPYTAFVTNHLLTLKRGLMPRSKYAYGPVLAAQLHYKYRLLFNYVIMSLFGHAHLSPTLVSPVLDTSSTSVSAALFFETIPTVKLMYPEPFIASASSLHYDLWFIHILLYQYWLWFVFVFLIIFFFLMFLATLRWCNPRVKPRLETRGVSRSKCADLITACVPVTWAASIIVNETTDAIDFFDGFGTADIVIGVRAYQWGWEYYYPRDVDFLTLGAVSPALHVGSHSLLYNNDGTSNFTHVAASEQRQQAFGTSMYDDLPTLWMQSASILPILETNSFFLTQNVTKSFWIDTRRDLNMVPLRSFFFFEYNLYSLFLAHTSLYTTYYYNPALGAATNTIDNANAYVWRTSTAWYDYDFKLDLATLLANETYWTSFYDWIDGTSAWHDTARATYAPLTILAPYVPATLYGATYRMDMHTTSLDFFKITANTAYNNWLHRLALYVPFIVSLSSDNTNVAAPTLTNWFSTVNYNYSRAGIRNLLTSAGAVQKVFKSRLDDTKSFLLLTDLAINENQMPLVESGAYYTLRTFTKNTNSRSAYYYYSTESAMPATSVSLAAFNNTRWAPFMFFNACQSDAARYIWLDWYAKWGMVSIQPASHSRYTLFGVPHLNNALIKNGRDLWLDTETYFMRLTRARRASYSFEGLGATYYAQWVTRISSFTASNILSKHHYSYQTFTAFNNTYTRSMFNIAGAYETLQHMHFPHITNLMPTTAPKWWAAPARTPCAATSPMLKDTHITLKKGINNLIRLHATGAIAFPTEIRINILASSKDVIHSWAIPSAGIKIDCIPGYSSHRTFLFLLSGIFWGQCMEICGRYHHWMPIVVFFMKRDLFFLWCTHFIFTSDSSETSSHLNTTALYAHRPVAAPLTHLLLRNKMSLWWYCKHISTPALYDIFFLKKEPIYTKLKYSRVPQYDIISGGFAALLAGLFGFLICEKFGFEMVDSGDFFFIVIYVAVSAVLCQTWWRAFFATTAQPIGHPIWIYLYLNTLFKPYLSVFLVYMICNYNIEYST